MNSIYFDLSFFQPVPTKYSGIDTSNLLKLIPENFNIDRMKHTGKKAATVNIAPSATDMSKSNQRPSYKEAVPKPKTSSQNLSSCKPVTWSKLVNME